MFVSWVAVVKTLPALSAARTGLARKNHVRRKARVFLYFPSYCRRFRYRGPLSAQVAQNGFSTKLTPSGPLDIAAGI
jgi:hypothetical protein